MLQAFINIFRIAELRNKIFFTLGMLCIYRIGFFIPLAGIDQVQMKAWAERQSGGATGNILDYVSIFTGGSPVPISSDCGCSTDICRTAFQRLNSATIAGCL